MEGESLAQRLRQKQRQQRQDDEVSSIPHGPVPGGSGYDSSIEVTQLVPERPIPGWVLKHGRAGRNRTSAVPPLASPPSVLGGMPLDCNNQRKAWKARAAVEREATEREQTLRRWRREPIRPYPGPMREMPMADDSAVAMYYHERHSPSSGRKRFAPARTDGAPASVPLALTVDSYTDPSQQFEGDYLNNHDDGDVSACFAVPPMEVREGGGLNEDPDYLHIDQSEMPLELFDEAEFEDHDLAPEQWVANGSGAVMPHYRDGEWHWERCQVLSYQKESGRFRVKRESDGAQKEVRRLQLLFDAENRGTWDRRRSAASAAREAAKQRLRLDYFVARQSMEEVRPVQAARLRAVHERVADGLPCIVPFPAPGSMLGTKLRELTKEAIQAHARCMKKAILFYKVRHSEESAHRYRQLRLPELPARPPQRWRGKVDIPRHAYRDKRKAVTNIHYSCLPETLGAFLWIHALWEASFAGSCFVDTALEGVPRPCPLAMFCAAQERCCTRLTERLATDWRRAFSERLADGVQDVYDLFQSDERLYRHSALHRLLRHLELRMNGQIRSLFHASLAAWRTLIARATPEEEEADQQAQGQTPLLQVRLVVVQAKSGEYRVAMEPCHAEIEAACLQCLDRTVDAVTGFTTIDADLLSLLHLRPRPIFALGSRPDLDHGPASAAAAAAAAAAVGRGSLNGITVAVTAAAASAAMVAADLTAPEIKMDAVVGGRGTGSSRDGASSSTRASRGSSSGVRSGSVSAAIGPYAEAEADLRATREFVKRRLTMAMAGPLQLAKLYGKYCGLMETDPEETAEAVAYADPPLSDPVFLAKVQEYHDAVAAIERLSLDAECFRLVRVTTSSAKDVLRTRAAALRDAMLAAAAGAAASVAAATAARYQALLARVAEKPADEAQLAALREFIAKSKGEVALLSAEGRRVRKRLEMVESFGFRPATKAIEEAWRLVECPALLDHAAARAEEAIEIDKVQMMDKLALEKEKFDDILERLRVDVERARGLGDYDQTDANTDYVNSIKDALEEAKRKAEDFNARERVFGFPPTEYATLGQLDSDLAPFHSLWNMAADFASARKEWTHGPFLELNYAIIERDISEWWKASYKASKSLEEISSAAATCAARLRDETTAFREHLPIIQALASPALKSRHWELLSAKIGAVVEPDDELTLQQLVDMQVGRHFEVLQEVCVAAEKEYGLERMLTSMKEEWTSVDLELKPYKETATFLIAGVDDIITLLDDHLVKTQTMRGSPYVGPMEAECRAWEQRLKYSQGLIDEWVACQRTWLYLEPIFGSEDIMRQLPTEARRFAGVDSLWKKTLEETNKDPSFMVQADPDKKLEEKFRSANQKLEEIQKGLSDYLEMKRLYFPRFFFLSNDELLEILSQTKEPRAVQPHLNKAFEGISKCRFEADLKITQMISAEGEVVPLDTPVDPESAGNRGNVERWLLELEAMQWQSIRTHLGHALAAYPHASREQWVLHWPAQVVLAVSQIYWTSQVIDALRENDAAGLPGLVKRLTCQLREITLLVRGPLSSLERKTLGALCTIDVHARDTVARMAEQGVCREDDFEWVSQLRYYWEDSWKDGQAIKKGDPTTVARIVNARCLYGYEYLGNSMRLVITPLTDRCYRTMIGAIDLLYGGAPEGPAGTGKTETVKDLSKAVAIQCVVFNCSDGLDYLAMAKFFKGLAGCGSWCCFDEFNRINVEVLSVIAQQILTINKAKKAMQDKFHFEGTYMKINHNANAFITMNPGYAGRAELPDNLKALFRPCAMMVPDYALIAEIRLYSFGFEDARTNAQKLVRVLQLCSEQLSSQRHYDYGMRAVNAILVAAGALRQQLNGDTRWGEAHIVLRSINEVNVPKFTVEDLPLFIGITTDLFPGIRLAESNHGSLRPALVEVCKAGITIAAGRIHRLEMPDGWARKAVELYEMVRVRHGAMVVGEAGSGKTTTIHALAAAMTRCCENGSEEYQRVQIHTMNPKAITSGQLYGNFDENTHEWNDGVLAVVYRRCAKDECPDRQWLIFDGPVDAIWIENMNTVLDDNKKLCLMSGEIIKMSDQMTMVFEAEDLEQASPATVSRVGMIFCETRNLGWRPLRDVWLASLPTGALAELRHELEEIFEWLFPPAQFFVQKQCGMPTPVSSQALAASLIRLLGVLFDAPDGLAADLPRVLDGLFVMALVWSVGACVDAVGRAKFAAYLDALTLQDSTLLGGGGDDDPRHGSGFRAGLDGSSALAAAHADFLTKNRNWVARPRPTAAPLPEGGIVYDCRFDGKRGQWVPWLERSARFVIPVEASFASIVVPTLDTIRHEHLLRELLLRGHHVLVTGDTGTGKSVSVKALLLSGMGERFSSVLLNFSARTSANQTQDVIDNRLDKRRKGVLGPPLGTSCVVFVDDLNMPAKEDYGAQPPIEILRQWMDHGGWYDRKENSFRQLVDIQFAAAMGPPGGGRTNITQRYLRHFSVINFAPFDAGALQRIFGTIMDWFLARGFSPSVRQAGTATVAATACVYSAIVQTLLPTPAKSHYTFNLRDVSKVFQGMLQGSPALITEKEQLVRLWAHECTRVFADRLVDDADRSWFQSMLVDKLHEHFGVDCGGWLDGATTVLLFGDFSDAKSGKVYRELSDHARLTHLVEDFLEDFNATSIKPMSLVLFKNAVEQVCRISRVINLPMGNALLVGVGGSGRKSLTTLAVHIAGYRLFCIELNKSYGVVEWREDIKRLLLAAGVDNQPVVFLLDDTQILHESFLEDLNGILNTGEVPNLFNSEDLTALTEAVARPAQAAGVGSSATDLIGFFTERARTNLHVVLCLSPIGDAFRTRLRMFPSLVNCCAINWFTAWPDEALVGVARHFLDPVDMDTTTRTGVVSVCVDMQQRALEMAQHFRRDMGRHYYVTPTSYLELINTFKSLLSRQRRAVLDRRERYDNGLLKLAETEAQVAQMQRDLEQLQPRLREATASTDALLAQIAADAAVASEKKTLVEKEEAACARQAAEAGAMKADCEADLAEALPALDAALEALKSLSKGDIVEVKAMKKPPQAVKLVMEAVCIMMGVRSEKVKDPAGGTKKIDDFWGPAQKHLLGDARFLQNLMDYDKDGMDPAMVELVQSTYVTNPDFDPEKVRKGSVAAAGLCKWVHAMAVYYRVARVVAPKRAALAAAEASLAAAAEDVADKQRILADLMERLAALRKELDAAEAKKTNLQEQVTDCSNKLRRAEQLTSGLGGEKSSWARHSEALRGRYTTMTGDMMLSAGVVAYLGAFTAFYREQAISQWGTLLAVQGIPCSPSFSLESTLGEPIIIRQWVIARLPNDSFSVDNAIMLFESTRWPLMIDPQGQANKWVRRLEGKGNLKIVKQSQANFVRTVENAIQFGSPVLLENVPESIDPVLTPVLLKQVATVGGVTTMHLGDSSVEYDPRFRLYMTTKLPNPHYPPELCVRVNLLNFVATSEGLEDQMLGIVVAREEPELETKREALVLEDAQNKRTQKEIEDTILDLLKSSTGNILDDETLIETLAQSKATSNTIERKLREAARTQETVAKARRGYAPVAQRASQLFFCIADLSAVDPMYQYSLEWFIALFESAIRRAPKGKNVEERLARLNDGFTLALYTAVCRSLFEKDKLLFSLLLTVKVMQGAGRLDAAELRFFLQGATSIDLMRRNPFRNLCQDGDLAGLEPVTLGQPGHASASTPADNGGWLSDKAWGEILALGQLPSMSGFDAEFEAEPEKWRAVCVAADPWHAVATASGEGRSVFQRLCLVRAIRPDGVLPAVAAFVAAEMGPKFVDPPPFDLAACFAEANCCTPLIFVLTPGADPMTELLRLADDEGYGGKRLTCISLGQGQGPLAERAIGTAAENGTWVCLQNCHLAVSWLPTLERICEELSPDRVHQGFRLWLSSEPSPYFPTHILQNGVKMTNEPPKGMRANLLGTYSGLDAAWLESCARPEPFKKLLFGLAFFHAAVRERRRFGPLGWNISYVFSGPDLRISMDQLRIFLDALRQEDPVPYVALAYLAGECSYGGRVTDEKDRRLLVNVLSDFYCPAILSEDYCFSPSRIYHAPPASSGLAGTLDYLRGLPYNEGPEVFGLHDNANILCALAETGCLLASALSLQPRGSTGSVGKSWDVALAEVAADIAARLPAPFDVERALLDFPVRYEESMNTVLTQELIRFNRLTAIVTTSLADVTKALRGLVLMSTELEAVGSSMVLGRVPIMWASVAYPSLKALASWVPDLLQRISFLRAWVEAGKAPSVFWISGFFFTQAFITGTLQNYARKHGTPIDEIGFDYRVLTPGEAAGADKDGVEDGAFVRGLFMDGARWDVQEHVLAESWPRELFVPVPPLHLLPRPREELPKVRGAPQHYTGDPAGDAHVYQCPVYKTSARQGALSTTGHSTNFVMSVNLPMGKQHSQKHWIKRGVAMLLQLDD